MIKKIIVAYCLLCLFCNCHKQNDQEVLYGSNNEFTSFLNLFKKKGLPMLIDTAFIKSAVAKSAQPIDSASLNMVGISEANILYEAKRKYLFYPLYRFSLTNHTGLLYYSEPNPDLPFDATISKIWMGIYKTDGTLSYSREVGLIDQQFGIEKWIFSTINAELVELKIIDMQEDFDTGDINTKVSFEQFLTKNGEPIEEDQ